MYGHKISVIIILNTPNSWAKLKKCLAVAELLFLLAYILAYCSMHGCAKVVVVPTFLSCGLLTKFVTVVSSIADGANKEDNGRAWKLSTQQDLEKR